MPKLTLNVTYSEMAALIAASGLNTQRFYKITDRGDRGLILQAATTNQLAFDGIRYMLCPATYATGADAYSNNWIGVWNAAKQATATEGQLCIWNGLVWKAGATLNGDTPDGLFEVGGATGWTVIPKESFTNHEYVQMTFGVTYDFENDWINKQWDGKGNVFGGDKYFCLTDQGLTFNPVDYCDWNLGTKCKFYKNVCAWIYNNSNEQTGGEGTVSDITNNSILGFIVGNSNKGEITDNRNMGPIADNSNNGDITGNINNGVIWGNSSIAETTCNIEYNTNNGAITGVWDADVTDTVVDKTGTAGA